MPGRPDDDDRGALSPADRDRPRPSRGLSTSIPIAMASAVARAWDLTVGDRIRLDSAANTAAYDTPNRSSSYRRTTPRRERVVLGRRGADAAAGRHPGAGSRGGFLPQIVLVSGPGELRRARVEHVPGRPSGDFVPPGTSEASPGLTHEWRYVPMIGPDPHRRRCCTRRRGPRGLNLARGSGGRPFPHVATDS